MAKALGVPFGRAARDPDGPWLVVGSGPGEWLVLAPPGAAAPVAGWLGTMAAESAGEEFVSVVDLTHGRALMRITGLDAAELLARLCGADLHDDMAPDGAALRAPVAGVATDIVRTTAPGCPRTCCTASARPASTCSARWSARASRSASASTASACRYLTPEKRNTMVFPSDLEIARGAALKPLEDVADAMGIPSHLLEPHGEEVMKIKLGAIAELADQPAARYVVVSAITPTPLGEGKTTTTVGLGQGFKHIGKRATVAIRQPSMGPTFGIKGGASRPAGTARSSPWRRSTCT